ncbi:Oidioi.mRNA.OKI2018_I69.chr2.g7578.t1.cds [Oikopleura dioica]|uniref:Oidioi.mRNA.OKI2018_I69.chr2.g7578.t1.cds n=1 Tax=Oikopleura dioica TaxID=34765 RepID=A0ABN7TFH7_OIKDI|nr:Oidioi.mRNA.OKI2018_I69.chr2.g7578.t1.cds [Oikopleura dioica]
MKIHSYSLPELFCSYELDASRESQFDLIYMVNRVRSRFSPIDGYLIFSQNTVYSTNIDRQSVYILMIYLTSMFSDAENGFIDLGFDTFFLPTKNSRQEIFVYHRQAHFCVFLMGNSDQSFPLNEVKSFLDKNLPLKREEQNKLEHQNAASKEAFHYYICDEQNGNSKDTFYSFSGSERQCRIHPSVSSLIVAFQQIYLMPNGGEVSAETSDNTWILTKSDNKKMSVFVEKKPSEKNLSDITTDVDKILASVQPGISFETELLRKK